MIQRYTNPEMGAIWSDQRRYETWLDVELAAADAMADAGIIPKTDALAMRAHLVDDADFLIVMVDAHEHRCGGHWRLIHPLRLSWHVMEG